MNRTSEPYPISGSNDKCEGVETRGREFYAKGDNTPSPGIPGQRVNNNPFSIPIRPSDVKVDLDFPRFERVKVTTEINRSSKGEPGSRNSGAIFCIC